MEVKNLNRLLLDSFPELENEYHEEVDWQVKLEEYIPLKVLIDRKEEPVKYISYLKDKTSLLELAVGKESGFIRKITLLLSEEYDIKEGALNINVYETGDLKINDELKNSCSYFKTYLYDDGIKIVISQKEILKYVRMDRVYIGLSDLGSVAEICLCQLTPNEINHIKDELEQQEFGKV